MIINSNHHLALLFVGAITFIFAPPASAERGNPRVEFAGQSIDEMVADYMSEHDVPGMTLAIVQAPYISRVVGYGVSDVEKRLLASPKTLWNVGQMTQAYTAVAIMQLVEAGQLSLDDAIGKYVAALPAPWQAITVRQLLAHASGLPDYTQQPAFDPVREYRPEEIIALVRQVPLAVEPGTDVVDSATDFYLLGLVVAQASGTSYQDFVTKNQFQRLGLKNTRFASDLAAVRQEPAAANNFQHREFLRECAYIDPAEAATGYAERHGQITPVQSNSPTAWFANGDIYASAEDISFWDVGLAGELLLRNKENRDFLFHPARLDNGALVPAHCGWRFPAHKGFMDIEGNVPGFSCYLARFTDKSELCCVTLCANQEGLDLSELARRIAGAFDRRLGPPIDPQLLACRESCYSVPATIDRLENDLRSHDFEFTSRVDRSADLASRTLDEPPTELLVTAGPAGNLPARIFVWQEPDGTVWTGYRHDSGHGSERDNRDSANESPASSLEDLLRRATTPY